LAIFSIGWEEGLLGACVGETRELVIPPEKAYGKKGSPPVIPPDATLTFNVELLAAESGKSAGRSFNLGEILIVLAFFGAVAGLLIYLPKLNELDKQRRKPGARSPKKERAALKKSK
jgi:hypothetical protein